MAGVTTAQLKAVIDPLGDLEPDEIAQLIRTEVGTHKAVCRIPSLCAVAVYVSKKLNLNDHEWPSVGVYSTEIRSTDDSLEFPLAWHPQSVEEFIKAFDRGDYPDLVKHREEEKAA